MAKIQLEGILKLIDVDINPAIFQKISRATSTLPISFSKMAQSANQAGGAVNSLGKGVGGVNRQLSIGTAFAQKFLQRMAQFAILLPIFSTLNKALQGSVRFLADFESELLNIARVDPKNAIGKLDQIAESALNIGIQFGASAIEVVKTIKVFVQAGESIESALEKARVATLATQVSTLELAQAQELLIGVSKQFRDEALADIDVLDKVSKVEDLSAADAAELAEAFVTGGNAISFATKSFDDSIGIIAALREQTRKSGREIGTFLKTLSTRILAAGESRSALEQLGVTVENLDGSLRPLMDILRDTKTAFDGLTESEAANAAKAIGGVRQFESLLATLQSLDKAQILSAGSAQAQGTSMQKQEIVANKLTYQTQQMIAEFEKLAAALGDNGALDFFKDAVKAARGFAIALQAVVDIAKKLDVSLFPLLAAGGAKLGQIAFGIGKTALGKGGGAAAGAASQFGFVGSPNKQKAFGDTLAGTITKLVAFQAASIAASQAQQVLTFAAQNSAGVLSSSFSSLSDAAGAVSTGFQVASVLGLKAGVAAAGMDLLITSLSKIVTAVDEEIKARQESADFEKQSQARKQAIADAAEGGTFTNDVLEAIKKNLSKTGGKASGDFRKGLETDLRRAIKNAPTFLEGKEKLNKLNVSDLFNDQFIKNIGAADSSLVNLNKAITDGATGGNLLTALYQDLNRTIDESAVSVVQFTQVFKDLKALKEREQLREQEKAINDLLRERIQLQRTDIPLFQSQAEALKQQADAMAGSLDVTTALTADLKKFVSEQPGQLGFFGKDASKSAVKFVDQLQEAFNKAGDKGEFVLQHLIESMSNLNPQDLDQVASTLEEAGVEADVTADNVKQVTDIIQFAVGVFKKGLDESVDKERVLAELRKASAEQAFQLERARIDAAEAAANATTNIQLALMRLGSSAETSSQDIDDLRNLTTSDYKAILEGGGQFSDSVRGIIETLAGTDLQQAARAAQISTADFAKQLEVLDTEITKVKGDLAGTKGDVSQTTGKSRVELTKELGDLEVKRLELTSDAEQAALKNAVEGIKARQAAEKEAIEKAKQMANALDDLADAEFKLKNGTEDAARSFREFTEQTLQNLAQKDADAQSNLKSAQQEVLSSTQSLDEAFKGLKESIISFNDTMAAAQVEAGLLGIQMQTLQGGLNTISSRVGALNSVFNSAIKDANISLKQRIDLERQLANETLSFLQNARNEIVNAGLEVFGQSPQENAQLQQGIDGLKFVADKLGGSFDAFSRLDPGAFDKISQELLSLPTSFRQSILDALRTLPSSVSIGGFSVEQLETALGQVGAGVNEQVGLPEIADIMSQEKEQLAKLQELAISDAELQLSQVVSSLEQLELAKTQLEASQVQADRAAEEVIAVREELITENAALEAAADQREKLTAQLLKATDNATIRQIEAQAREFASQVPLFTDISDKLLEIVQAIGGLKSAQFSAEANIPAAGRGWIPNYAGGKLTTREAYGLLRAGAREKRMMPGGAGLAVANTSETIIPSRYRGYIPNFAAGSEIASSIQAVNGVNAAVVAAITNSINNVITRLQQNNPTANEELNRQQLDKLDNILSTLQEISTSNTSIDTAVNQDTGATAQTGTEAIQPIQINVTSNGRNVVQVAGLDNLETALKEGIRRAQEDQADQLLQPVNSAVEAIFRVLRERGLISSFGQGQ